MPVYHTRILANDVASYGALHDHSSKDGDSALSDSVTLADGRAVDLVASPAAGKDLDFEDSCTTKRIEEVSVVVTDAVKFGNCSGDTLNITGDAVCEHGHLTNSEPGGYGAGYTTYGDLYALNDGCVYYGHKSCEGSATVTELRPSKIIDETP